MRHKHAELIKAWLDGKECEFWSDSLDDWQPISSIYGFMAGEAVRLKPELEEPQYLYVYNHATEGKTCMSTALIEETYGRWKYMGKVRVEK
jgi:hypothetical protein